MPMISSRQIPRVDLSQVRRLARADDRTPGGSVAARANSEAAMVVLASYGSV
jgi:hypothetical protein